MPAQRRQATCPREGQSMPLLDAIAAHDEETVAPQAMNRLPEVSIVMPCLNEKETLAACIMKAQRSLETNIIIGEIIIADNGSTDGSQEIARGLGARVIA